MLGADIGGRFECVGHVLNHRDHIHDAAECSGTSGVTTRLQVQWVVEPGWTRVAPPTTNPRLDRLAVMS